MISIDTHEFAELEQAGWSDPATAQAYATDFAKAANYSVTIMLDRAGVGVGTRMLDLCCGHGILAKAALARGAEVVGVDFSPAMLELARARAPEASFQEGNAMNLAFDADSFDAVVVGFGIPHVPDPKQVLVEAARVLRPGGRLAYSAWQDRKGAMQYVFQAIGAHGAKGIALPPGPGAHDYADPERASSALADAGFDAAHYHEIDSRWQIKNTAQVVQFFEQGTVRGGAVLRPQPAENLSAIRKAVHDQIVANHGNGPEWDLPIPSVVVSATVN